MNLTAQRPIRLLCDLASNNNVLEQGQTQPPVMVRSAAAVFQLGLARYRTLFAEISTTIASLTVQVRASSDPSSEVYLERSIASGFNDSLTDAAWNALSDQHCEVSFTAEECNITAGSYWLAIWFTTSGGEIVPVAFGKIIVKESGAGVSGTPATPGPQYYTRTEIDARFPLLAPENHAYRIAGGFLQLKDSASGNWRKVWFENGALQIGAEEE